MGGKSKEEERTEELLPDACHLDGASAKPTGFHINDRTRNQRPRPWQPRFYFPPRVGVTHNKITYDNSCIVYYCQSCK